MICGWEADPSMIYYEIGGTAYRVPMDSNARPASDPELWLSGSPRVRQFLDFRDGRALGTLIEQASDLWLMEFEAVSSGP